MTNVIHRTKATLDLVPGDIVLNGVQRDEVVQVLPPTQSGSVVVRVDVLRDGCITHFLAGLNSSQVVEELA